MTRNMEILLAPRSALASVLSTQQPLLVWENAAFLYSRSSQTVNVQAAIIPDTTTLACAGASTCASRLGANGFSQHAPQFQRLGSALHWTKRTRQALATTS